MKTLLFYLTLATMAFSVQAQTKQPVKTGMAEVNGTELYYEVAGEGEPLVLIHRNCGDRRDWDDQFMLLSKRFRVIRYDVRGYGKSTMPDPGVEYEDYSDLKSLLDYLEIERAHICGLYHGIEVDFAIAYPNKCLSLIAAAPWANGYRSPVFPTTDKILFKPWTNELREHRLDPGLYYDVNGYRADARRSETLETANDNYSWLTLNKSNRQFLRPPAAGRLIEIKVPTLIVTSEHDLEFCKEVADLMEREIAGAKKVSIKGAGPCMNKDKPHEFNRIVVKFIQEVENRKSNESPHVQPLTL
jgi:pimeloyl-ACP methyl ester carboxylesterase